MPKSLELRIQRTIVLTLVLTTLAVSPWMSLDPINLIKYFFLVTGALTVLGMTLSNFQLFLARQRTLLILLGLFLLCLFASLFFSGAAIIEQLVGAYGRNTGLITYSSLAVLMMASGAVSQGGFINRLLVGLLATGTFNCIYGFFQYWNLDPVNWNNPYNPIFGTLGNPNFVSTFLGITASVAFALFWDKSKTILFRLYFAGLYLACAFLIWKSDSIQGLVLITTSTVLVSFLRFGFFRIAKSKSKLILSSFPIIGGFIFAGFFNYGPLSKFLFQQTGEYRVDYWKAGIRMTFDHPIFGVGLDGYGDWYRTSRDLAATIRRGPEMVSNSAHNIFLDISSNGGFPLLITYLLLVFLTLSMGWKMVSKSTDYDARKVALVVAYLCYLLQSLISINQIGLAIWGWVLAGAIVGYEKVATSNQPLAENQRTRGRVQKPAAGVVLASATGLCIGLILAIPPIKKDNDLRRALEAGDGQTVLDLAYSFPQTSYYMNYAMIAFTENRFEDKAYKVAQDTVVKFPRNFKAWELLYKTELSTKFEKSSAQKRLIELDPNNENIKN